MKPYWTYRTRVSCEAGSGYEGGWEEEAQSARVFRRLADTARLWQEKKAGLFRDPDLQIALSWRIEERPNSAWAEQYGGQFDEAVRFLDASREAVEAEEREQERGEATRIAASTRASGNTTATCRGTETVCRSATLAGGWPCRRGIGRRGCLSDGMVVTTSQRNEARSRRCSPLKKRTENVTSPKPPRGLRIRRRPKPKHRKKGAEQAAENLKRTLVLSDFGRSIEKLAEGDARGSLASLGRALRQDNTYWPGAMRALSTMSQRSFLLDDVATLEQEEPIDRWGVSPKSNLVWSTDLAGHGVMWDGVTGEQLYSLADGEPVQQVRLSQDGNTLLAIVGDTIKAWHARTGKSFGADINVQGMNGGFLMVETESDDIVVAGTIRQWNRSLGSTHW